jgi:hypothetical protein
MARLLAAAVAVLLLAGCYGGSASPTPGDMTDVLGELTAHGVTMTDTVAGDPGCADPSLFDNARRLVVTSAADGRSYTVYLFRWRNVTDYNAAADAFDACVAAFAGDAGTITVETVDVSPWRAYGPGWTAEVRDAVQQALEGAGSGQ